jgi:hypothetical protein
MVYYRNKIFHLNLIANITFSHDRCYIYNSRLFHNFAFIKYRHFGWGIQKYQKTRQRNIKIFSYSDAKVFMP